MSIITKLKEPSTIRGIITMLGLFGYTFNPQLAEPIAVVVGGLLAFVEILRNENATKEP